MTDREFHKLLGKHSRERYERYLLSKEWKAKRQEAFRHHGKFCHHCRATKYLQVHHLTYVHLFDEPMEDLQIVCRTCHKIIHGKYVLEQPKTKAKRSNCPTPEEKAKKERKKELSKLIAQHNAEVMARRKTHKKGDPREPNAPGSLLRYMSNNRGVL